VRDVRRHGVALGREAERGVIGAADAAAAIDEGIEHQVEELVAELETDLLRAGRGFAGKLVQGSGEIGAGQPIERHECWRQRAAVVEEVVNRAAGVDLVAGEGGWRVLRRVGRVLRRNGQPRYRRQRPYRPLRGKHTTGNELRPQVEFYAIVEIIEPGPQVAWQAKGLEIFEPARAPVVGGQNGVAAREIDAREENGRDVAVQRGGAAHIDARSRPRVHLHDIKSIALNGEIAGDGHRTGCSHRAGDQETPSVDEGRAHGAAAKEHGAAVHSCQARRRDRAVHDQCTGIYGRRPRISIGLAHSRASGT
jgi:hypothetical protein